MFLEGSWPVYGVYKKFSCLYKEREAFIQLWPIFFPGYQRESVT